MAENDGVQSSVPRSVSNIKATLFFKTLEHFGDVYVIGSVPTRTFCETSGKGSFPDSDNSLTVIQNRMPQDDQIHSAFVGRQFRKQIIH